MTYTVKITWEKQRCRWWEDGAVDVIKHLTKQEAMDIAKIYRSTGWTKDITVFEDKG